MQLDKTTKFFLIGSVVLLLSGLFWHFLGRYIPWSKIPLGRLPGDIYIKKENSSFYFPLTTGLLLSLLFSLLMRIFRK